jgi:hypothetical protein
MAEATSNTHSARSEGQKLRYRSAVVNTTHICCGCGLGFKPKRSDRIKYCSRECAFAHSSSWNLVCRPRTAAIIPALRLCRDCQSPIGRQKILCDPCRSATVYKSKRVCKSCADCSAQVTGGANTVRCVACRRKRAVRRQRELHGKVKKHRQRARKYQVAYVPINPVLVFERDGWKCQVCLSPTPQRLRGSTDPRAPELDHRVPMSKGGPHTWDNVQCCCRKCNTAKGSDLVVGQCNLFPSHQ